MTGEGDALPNPDAGGRRSDASLADPAFPSEPFPCPACGQMLAPTVRVCVVCKYPIDSAEIARARSAPARVEPRLAAPIAARAPFPWPLFLILLGVRLASAVIAQPYLGVFKTEVALGGMEFLSAIWVLRDAVQKRIPRPGRWMLGSLFLWIFIFPWYLARRKTPRASCPFIEADTGLAARVLLFVLIVFLLLGMAVLILKGPVAKP